MPDPFASSHIKIAWAKKNISKLQRRIKTFFLRHGGYVPFTEPHPDKPGFVILKVRLKKPFPNDIPVAVSDILGNLRSSLDHAVYGIALHVATSTNSPNPKIDTACFPFAKDAAHFENTLKGRCASIPLGLHRIFRECQPYKGGNAPLWALNVIRGTNEHAFIVPAIGDGFVAEMIVEGAGFWSAPAHPVWDSAKNEMELMTLGSPAKLKGNFKLAFQITFGEVEEFSGRNVGQTLNLFFELVETIVGMLETESKRLGIIP